MSNDKAPNNRKLFIAVEGSIGIGKTTLVKWLSEQLNYTPYYEPLDGELGILREMYYDNPDDHALNLQIRIFMHRFKQHQQILVNNEGAIQDRSLFGDKPFAYMLHDDGIISREEIRTYEITWEVFRPFIVYPDVMIFLTAPTDILMQRIIERSRNGETAITTSYLEKLNDYIMHALKNEMMNAGVRCIVHPWDDPNARRNTLLRQLQDECDRPIPKWRC